ncbi:MAG: dihydroneopterin aldolase [Chloroflexi bacterium CFX1]|nr:dihydroneopterin aldolase [Chloroflexi bacterium CFX1]MCQ3954440.1 dihydroneopterin aldolase [Chloroflexota bacterium]MDL1918712.1 dihydroneopterin aldolase [Chloroflexi bacterium CFX5]NUQ60486.1 dihydroneopterin aldolase [Anaerolineales bacterium]
MDKIFIKDLLARGIIGVREWERKKPQDILINATVFADTIRAGETDDVADSVDYSALAKILQTHAESAARLTVEALASDLAKLCLELPGVKKVIVRVEKPGAVKFTKSVGVEIERVRSATALPRG